ncbi:hypothetical protein F4780DRAFT_730468 [Xylariomycetidae sp. FL0641]|nr:hypothetical protein F4780DRAFT_730468 [Xylariomycetidae sp. FL0641]
MTAWRRLVRWLWRRGSATRGRLCFPASRGCSARRWVRRCARLPRRQSWVLTIRDRLRLRLRRPLRCRIRRPRSHPSLRIRTIPYSRPRQRLRL